MNSLVAFVEEINKKLGISLPREWKVLDDLQVARRFLEGVNRYFFQTYQGIGTTDFQGEELEYFSEFHRFWEANHASILNARIRRAKATMAAKALKEAIRKYGRGVLSLTHQTSGLAPRAVAQVRFFTANQDFREPPENQFSKYLVDPTRFDPQVIAQDPADFLRFLGMTRLSQTDKRLDFAANAAGFLLEHRMTAFEISQRHANDAVRVREALVSRPNMGYGSKKANMFIRDMAELSVWPHLANFDALDVASDINTMKVALRTGILYTDIPLLSSFLDIFCHQYGHIDEMSAMAWRAVWEAWRDLDPNSAPASPCLMDFLLYRVGREYCKDNLVRYACREGHVFYHFGGRLRRCKTCGSEATRAGQILPCQADPADLPREDGELLLADDNLLRTFDGVCLFESVCMPKTAAFRLLDPPKSISIKGQTGWTSAYADRDRGGGGLMS